MRPTPIEQRTTGVTSIPDAIVKRIHELQATSDLPVGAYLYDPNVAADKAARLVEVLPDWVQVFYAVKANGFPPVLHALAAIVDGFDVASLHEARLASTAASTSRPTRLLSSGPGKTEQHLLGLLSLGVELVNVESGLELRRLARLAEAVGQRPQIAIRVNPAARQPVGSISIGGRPTPFGVDERAVPSVLAAAKALPSLDVAGFHFHEACNNLDAESHAAYVQWCLDWSSANAAAHGLDLRVVDVGGGIGIGADDCPPFDIALFGRRLTSIEPPTGCRVLLEPGRYLVAECGFYAAEVLDVKESRGTWFAVLRGGINHFLRPALGDYVGTIGIVSTDRWDSADPRPGVHDTPVTLVGELCSPSDILARVGVAELRAGDVIVFSKAGSYGWELALQAFLGHPLALRTTLHETSRSSVAQDSALSR